MNDITARVAARRDEADGVFSLELVDASGAALPPWTPGAHIDVGVGAAGVRQYSLCGDPADRSRWRIAVLHEPAGRGGSDHLYRTATPGALLPVSRPRNNFELVAAPEYLFLAGGIGITPILPMTAAAVAAGARWTLCYGGRTRTHMAFADTLAARYPQVSLRPQDETGLLPITELFDRHPGAVVYCCGPEPLLDAVRAEGARRGAEVHVERFAPRPVAPAEDRAFEIRLAGDGRTFRVAPGQSIVDVLEAAGVGVLTNCREGTCGSCETGVLAGAVEHRDSVLDDEERAASRTMMLCVSRARQDLLVLDL
ncbi:PDR/VanB family oxidoreductase [Nocardia farcinica]|uniref:PDR/VanB family oxidoreductase n=1 Tax=Nocardia farcinica TaxID=37329 RepID=UPI00189308B3|nr:PDR/VanB family oxidoreductase [Nocardia farcinica]MBF6270505.1 oxidoreductase [Nocardia farcinica]MCZ9325690.1 PDR/VanB family oxidoreductase [Nocardia farcinica]